MLAVITGDRSIPCKPFLGDNLNRICPTFTILKYYRFSTNDMDFWDTYSQNSRRLSVFSDKLSYKCITYELT
jgi:tRNA A37 threonylcarbamoyladenosine biosynthesis protein TsaE